MISIDGDWLTIATDQGDRRVKSKPIRMVVCEATIGSAVCPDNERSRAFKKIEEEFPRLGKLLTRRNGRAQWVDTPPAITVRGRPLNTEMAAAMANAHAVVKNLAPDVFTDLGGWKSIFRALQLLRADGDIDNIETFEQKLESDPVRSPHVQSLLAVLHWLLKRRVDSVATKLDKAHISMLRDSGINFAVPYIEQLGNLWHRRREAMLSGRVTRPDEPTAVSPTLLSYRHEVDGFLVMRKLRKSRGRSDVVIQEADQVLHSFAVSLIYAAVGQRLGRAVSCAANFASTYIELSVEDRVSGTLGPPFGDDRLLQGLRWLFTCRRLAFPPSRSRRGLAERKLVRRCLIASLRRVIVYAHRRPTHRNQRLESVLKLETGPAREALSAVLKVPFKLNSADILVATNEFCDLTELWRLALWRPEVYDLIPSKSLDSLGAALFTLPKELVRDRAEAAVNRLAKTYKETLGKLGSTMTKVHKRLRAAGVHYAGLESNSDATRMAQLFVKEISP